MSFASTVHVSPEMFNEFGSQLYYFRIHRNGSFSEILEDDGSVKKFLCDENAVREPSLHYFGYYCTNMFRFKQESNNADHYYIAGTISTKNGLQCCLGENIDYFLDKDMAIEAALQLCREDTKSWFCKELKTEGVAFDCQPLDHDVDEVCMIRFVRKVNIV